MANLESLAQELGLLQLNLLPKVDSLSKQVADLSARVKILEEARQKQIALNGTFVTHEFIVQNPKPKPIDSIQPKKFKWF